MKNILIIALSVFCLDSYASSDLIIKQIEGRDNDLKQTFVLNSDGKTCTRTTNEGYVRTKTTSVVEDSKGCRALIAAKKIEEKFGACKERDISLKNSASKDVSLRLSGSYGFYTYHPLPDSFYGSATSKISCVCGQSTSVAKKAGLGTLNIGALFGEGPYYKNIYTFTTMSAEQCANFFPTEEQKQFVVKTYKELGLE